MSKRNVAYAKPAEPSFLRKLKEQVGYKEGPNVDTKREKLAECSDGSDQEDDSPQIVQLRPGDLSAEDVANHKREVEEGPADLKRRVIFKKPDQDTEKIDSLNSKRPGIDRACPKVKSKKPKMSHRPVGTLSFDADEDEL